MTEEEKAKTYALEVVQLEYEDFIHHQGSVPMETIIERVAYQAYLSGLNAGKDTAETDLATIAYMQGAEQYKTKWHKVADRDLPNNYRYVWTNVGAGYYDDDGWWDDFGRLPGVIAWCEPEFEE